MRRSLTIRARIIGGFFVAVALLLVARLYFVQVIHADDYKQQAVAQYVAPAPDTEDRGNIFFTTKDGSLVSAAVMQTGWRIAIDPEEITDPTSLYTQLNAIVPIDKTRFMTSATKKNDPYEEVAFRVSDADADKIRALDLPGVLLVADQWRFYPAHELASQIIGFVGYPNGGNSKVGMYGLEKSWQDTLVEPTAGLYVNPFAEIFTNVTALVSADPASHQGSVITSIEPNVQKQLEDTLDNVMQTYTPKLAGGIVMDPTTGKIVAMAGRPAFDPNTYNTVSDPFVYLDQMVEGRYEMGSIMKPLTMAAAIDSGAVTASSTYDDTGCVTESGKKVCNYDFKARGVIPMQQILSQSLNVGATYLANTMGHVTFTKYMKSYGFEQKTGIDLPDEIQGTLAPLGDGTGPDVNYATASFGQGVSVTPIEMTRALSAIANDGVLPNPHIVTGIQYESGITRPIDHGQGPRVFSTSTAEEVSHMLGIVYDDALLNGELKMQHYTAASKTGTAQIADPKTGTYYPDRYLHSFFGFFPVDHPRFIVFLFQVDPHGVEYASASLAHPFYDIMKYLINYYNIPPDR